MSVVGNWTLANVFWCREPGPCFPAAGPLRGEFLDKTASWCTTNIFQGQHKVKFAGVQEGTGLWRMCFGVGNQGLVSPLRDLCVGNFWTKRRPGAPRISSKGNIRLDSPVSGGAFGATDAGEPPSGLSRPPGVVEDGNVRPPGGHGPPDKTEGRASPSYGLWVATVGRVAPTNPSCSPRAGRFGPGAILCYNVWHNRRYDDDPSGGGR